MRNILENIERSKQVNRAWVYSLILCLYVTFFMLQGTLGEVNTKDILDMDPMHLLIGQGVISTFLFIGASFLFALVFLKITPDKFFTRFSVDVFSSVLLITICFMVVNSAIGEWNLGIDFPDSRFEAWAKQSEEQLRVLTEHLTNFQSPGHFLLGFLVIAIIPGIGEELLFRGLIQNLFIRAFSNHHIAIWVTGFIFAAIHMQFYGIVPRMLLGVLFGYIYFWTSNLSLAMLAHIINNGLALTLLYLSQNGSLEVSPEQMESSAPWPAILIFGIVGTFLLRRFYLKFAVENE